MSNHVDLSELSKVADGDQDFMNETLAILLEEVPTNLHNISEYVKNDDIPSLKKIVHKMKSSFMLIGMADVWPIIHTIEKSDSKETILGEVPKFLSICNEALEELKAIQANGGTAA